MNDQQLLRYSRHILLPQVDIAGQEALLASRVLVVGMGGLGSPVAMYLAAAGVGCLAITDDDDVDESNLQRQVIHGETDLGLSKVLSAAQTIKALNSAVSVFTLNERLSMPALLAQVDLADVVIDCSDNALTRKQLNAACWQLKKPLVSGAAIRLEGQLTVFDFREQQNPCYECLYQLSNEEELSCAQSGVLSPVVGIVGSAQALEAIKVLVGFGKPLVGRLALFDAAQNVWRYVRYNKNPDCPLCGG